MFTTRNEVGQGYVFTGICDSVHKGQEYLTRYTPPGPGTPQDQVQAPLAPARYPLGPGAPPGTRYTPSGPGTPHRTRYTPPGPGTPPRTRYTPLGTRYPPGPGTPPRTRYTPPGPGTSPRTRYTPQDQVHPLGPGTSPSGPGTPLDQVHPPGPGTPPRTRYTPLNQVHPQTRYTPQPRACWEIWSMRRRYTSYWNAILFYTCVSVHRGVCLSACWDTPPPAGTRQEQTPPGSRQPTGSRHPPPPKQTATVAEGMHPTGMHSCLYYILNFSPFSG